DHAVHLSEQHVEAQREAAEHSAETAHPAAAAHAAARLPEGVELVDEDEAAAPAPGLLLGGADHGPDRDHVHADEHAVEGGTGADDYRCVKCRGDALGEHGLAGAGGPDHEHAALALAARVDI